MVLELFLFTFVLSIDSFSAAIALGFRHFSFRRTLFFALSSGFSEGLAIAIGFLLGRFSQDLIMQYDHWVAFGLLLLVGCHMCYQAILEMKSPGGPEQAAKVHGWLKILIVSAITSIDSLGVGISLGLVGKPIVLYSVVVGLGAFVSTWVGIYLARRVASRFAERMEFVGGAVLIALGIKMLSI